MGHIAATIHTFGYLHHDIPAGDGLLIDLRHELRNPHHNPAMRELTGLHPEVRDHVLTTPGAAAIIASITRRIVALLTGYANRHGELVQVLIGCQGGRHRSVAIAEAVADQLRRHGIGVDVTHHHMHQPLIRRPATQEATS